MYEELLAYDEVSREYFGKKLKIQADINATDLAKEVNKLDAELSALARKNKQLEKKLEQLAAEHDAAAKDFDTLLDSYEMDAEQQQILDDDPMTCSDEFEENRRDLETKQTAVKRQKKILMNVATEADAIAAEIDKIQTDGKAKFKLLQTKKKELKELTDKEMEALQPLQMKKDEFGSKVDSGLRDRYDRIAVSHPDPLAVVVNGTCSGCRMSLPSAMTAKVSSGTMIICENCGRMIFNH